MNCFQGINCDNVWVFKYTLGVLVIMVGYGFPMSFTYGFHIIMVVWTFGCMRMVNWYLVSLWKHYVPNMFDKIPMRMFLVKLLDFYWTMHGILGNWSLNDINGLNGLEWLNGKVLVVMVGLIESLVGYKGIP